MDLFPWDGLIFYKIQQCWKLTTLQAGQGETQTVDVKNGETLE